MLKRVSIQNFKSLKDVTLDLQKVNLLIGPNNSGKTNFLKALEYMGVNRQIHSNEAERGNMVYGKNNNDKIIIQLKFDIEDKEFFFEEPDYYVFGCEINPNGSVVMEKWHQNLKKSHIKSFDANDSLDFRTDLNQRVGSMIIYKPDPDKLIKPGIVGIGAELVEADASNLIAFFDYIRDDQPEIFERIKTDLRKCVPEFSEINFQSVPSNDELIKQFGPGTYKRIGLTEGRQGVKYWADELSEGTLYFLALLCIINQPNPPKLLLLEEPEKGIHPRRIFEVIQFILRLSEEKNIQVIMTTHSPVVLDMFADMPESVFIFDKDEEEGATHVKNLQRNVIEPATKKSEEFNMEPPRYTDALGDAWTIGFLGGVPI